MHHLLPGKKVMLCSELNKLGPAANINHNGPFLLPLISFMPTKRRDRCALWHILYPWYCTNVTYKCQLQSPLNATHQSKLASPLSANRAFPQPTFCLRPRCRRKGPCPTHSPFPSLTNCFAAVRDSGPYGRPLPPVFPFTTTFNKVD